MALGDGRIYAARGGSTHGVTDLLSLTHFSVGRSSVKSGSPGPAGHPGLEDEQVTDRDLRVTLFFLDDAEAMALIEVAATNAVLNYVAEAGANWHWTIKNVKFNDPPADVTVPQKEAGVPAGAVSITGRAHWGVSDTWATMDIKAVDV